MTVGTRTMYCPICGVAFKTERIVFNGVEQETYTPAHADPTGEDGCDGIGDLAVPRKPRAARQNGGKP